MASTHAQPLLSSLKVSPLKTEALAKPSASARRAGQTAAKTPAKASHAPKSTRAPKLSVSLYQRDIDRLDTIKDYMRSQGFRNLSDSEALRLACRKVQINGSLVEVYRTMQGEDGRRRQE